MNSLAKKFLAVLLLLIIAASAQAELQWEKKTIKINAKPGEKEAVRSVLRTSFRFKNTGKTAVSIAAIQPDCGCVTTAFEKLNYAPGESGEIKITFNLEMEDVAGWIKKTIAVTTSDASKPTMLRLRVYVPQIFEITPKFLVWTRGEKPAAKETVLKAGKGVAPMKLAEPYPNSNDFSVEIKPEKPGHQYRVRITPKSTASPSYAQIHLQADSAAIGGAEHLKLYVQVQ